MIDDQMSEKVISQLLYLADKDVEEITIQINSMGGSVSAGLAIYDTMNYVKCPVRTVCIGDPAFECLLSGTSSRMCPVA